MKARRSLIDEVRLLLPDLPVSHLAPGRHVAVIDAIHVLEHEHRVSVDVVLMHERQPLARVLDAMSLRVSKSSEYVVDELALAKWPVVEPCRPGAGLTRFDRVKLAIVVAIGRRWR